MRCQFHDFLNDEIMTQKITKSSKRRVDPESHYLKGIS